MELSKTFQMPVKNKDNLIRFVIGGILDIIPVLNLLSSGYAFILMRKHIFENASESLPEWEGWGSLFKYGILTFLISLGYVLIPLAIIGLGVAAEATHVAILEYVGVTFDIIGGLSFLAAIFLFPMGIIMFAIDDEVSSAFAIFHVIDMTLKHIGSYLKAFIIIFVMGIVLGFLSQIPFIGWIISVFVGFYILLESALFFGDVGQAIAESTGKKAPQAEGMEDVVLEPEVTSAPKVEEKQDAPPEVKEEEKAEDKEKDGKEKED